MPIFGKIINDINTIIEIDKIVFLKFFIFNKKIKKTRNKPNAVLSPLKEIKIKLTDNNKKKITDLCLILIK